MGNGIGAHSAGRGNWPALAVDLGRSLDGPIVRGDPQSWPLSLVLASACPAPRRRILDMAAGAAPVEIFITDPVSATSADSGHQGAGGRSCFTHRALLQELSDFSQKSLPGYPATKELELEHGQVYSGDDLRAAC